MKVSIMIIFIFCVPKKIVFQILVWQSHFRHKIIIKILVTITEKHKCAGSLFWSTSPKRNHTISGRDYQHTHLYTHGAKLADWLICFSGRIPRLSLIQHSLYVGMVEKLPPLPLTGEQYGKMEPKYPEGGHCQSI